MATQVSHEHHYVPRWYQKRFLAAGQDKLWYLDLKPEKVVVGERTTKTKRALFRRYPAQCFWITDLYLLRFRKTITDIIEKNFFGKVDDHGERSVRFFATPAIDRAGLNAAYQSLLGFIAAQRLRTPHGLDWLRARAPQKDQNHVLMVMRQMFEAYNAMWMEGTWEIVSARNSATKFIISDDPVTFFNRKIFPGESYPGGNDFPKIGTRTIFPLGPDYCLIITHLQLIRNPWIKPLEERVNARLFGTTLGNLVAIQHSREVDELDVARINFILKKHATRYIAAGRALGNLEWSKLDDDWFLLPNVWKVRLASSLGPFRRFDLAHPKLLILCVRQFCPHLYIRKSRRSGGNVGIAWRFPRAVGRVETCFWFSRLSTDRHFHGLSGSVGLGSFLLLVRGSTETVRLGAGFEDMRSVGDAVE